ncbi:MAG: hypothetical protein HKO02_04540 [Hyphomonadaceae bacterium]|nr:hypothetical protein [Hyphomonadaceae bacterium]
MNVEPGISAYHDTFNDNPQSFKFMTGPAALGPTGYLGWAAMRKDDIYGEVGSITPPTGLYV